MSENKLNVPKVFSERMAHWTRHGFSGRDLYERLASDAELPTEFGPDDLATIIGVGVHALKKRRVLGQEPSFLRLSRQKISYPRADVCRWLASRYVKREAA
jgi:hypothetical protein